MGLNLITTLMYIAILPSTISGYSSFFSNISANDWETFLNLSGRRFGDRISGLCKLKEYFQRFGYIQTPSIEYSDDFDKILELAVKTYQKNFHLKPTGILDADTLKQIVQPRCGVADIINGTTTMNSTNFSGKSHTMAHYSYFPMIPRWPESHRQLSYAFSPENVNIAVEDLRSIFHRAFARWEAVTTLTFIETNLSSSSDIKIEFQAGEHGDGDPFDGPFGTLAHAFSPPNGQFHLDSSENWVVGDADINGIDIESVAVHEIGHLLGLGHSWEKEAIMYPTLGAGMKRVKLHMDDIVGIQALYGVNPSYGDVTLSSSSFTPETRLSGVKRGLDSRKFFLVSPLLLVWLWL